MAGYSEIKILLQLKMFAGFTENIHDTHFPRFSEIKHVHYSVYQAFLLTPHLQIGMPGYEVSTH